MKKINLKKVNVIEGVKRHAIVAIIASIIVFAIGVLMCILPGFMSVTMLWITFGLIALTGFIGICHFIVPGKGKERDPLSLILGLIVVALFIILLVCALTFPKDPNNPEYSGFALFSLNAIHFMSIFFGVIAIFNSIFGLFTIGSLPKDKTGFAIFSLILGLILGILMIVFPFALWIVSIYISAVYLIIISIFYIVIAFKAIGEANKAKKDYVVDAEIKDVNDEGENK